MFDADEILYDKIYQARKQNDTPEEREVINEYLDKHILKQFEDYSIGTSTMNMMEGGGMQLVYEREINN